MNAEPYIAVLQQFKADRVIKVLRIPSVNRKGQQIAQILSRRVICQIGRLAAVCVGKNIVIELCTQAHAHDQRIKRAGRLLETADAILHVDAQTALILPADDMRANDCSVLSFSIHIRYGNLSRQAAFKRLNDTRSIMYTQYAHDIFMRMRQYLCDNHMIASNAFSKNRVAKKCAACILLCARKRRAVFRFHADYAARHTANGQLNGLLFLRAHFADWCCRTPALLFSSHAGFMIITACIAFHFFFSCFYTAIHDYTEFLTL